MKKSILFLFILTIHSFFASAQSLVLVEQFTETGCGACSQNDSAFNALIDANPGKVAVISYHCFYSLDTFYNYNKDGYQRYFHYKLDQGFPSAMVNGKSPVASSSHLSYVNSRLINAKYNQAPQFKINLSCTPKMKGKNHAADILVNAISLKGNPSKNLRLFVVVTESNINHEKRYKTKAVNGIDHFDNIFRAMLPDTNGRVIGAQMTGQENNVKLSFTNDDREMNFKEVRLVVFIQDAITQEILGTVVTKQSPFVATIAK